MDGSSAVTQLAYLVPIALVNLTTLIVLVITMGIADMDGSKRLPNFDPTNPTVMIQSRNAPADDHVLVLGRNKDKKLGLSPRDKVSTPLSSTCILNSVSRIFCYDADRSIRSEC